MIPRSTYCASEKSAKFLCSKIFRGLIIL